jgi:hypothetical protein
MSTASARFIFEGTASPVVRGRTYTLSFSAMVHRNGTSERVRDSITRTYT